MNAAGEGGTRALMNRLMKEVQLLREDPPPGVAAWPVSEMNITTFEAHIQGPPNTPYERGTFVLDVEVPERYPFEPPRVRFLTHIFHPNIDERGRICLDTLKPQPQGTWTPCINIPTLLTTIRLLMAHPNADDGLSPEATHLYRKDLAAFERRALEFTLQHAVKNSAAATRFSAGSDESTPMADVMSLATDESARPAAPSHDTAEAMEGVSAGGDGALESSGEEEDWDSDVSLCGEESGAELEDMSDATEAYEREGQAGMWARKASRRMAVEGDSGGPPTKRSRTIG